MIKNFYKKYKRNKVMKVKELYFEIDELISKIELKKLARLLKYWVDDL